MKYCFADLLSSTTVAQSGYAAHDKALVKVDYAANDQSRTAFCSNLYRSRPCRGI